MPLSEKKKASNERWDKKNLIRMSLAVPVQLYARMKEHTEKTGQTVNGFIKKAIDDALPAQDEKAP